MGPDGLIGFRLHQEGQGVPWSTIIEIALLQRRHEGRLEQWREVLGAHLVVCGGVCV